MTEKLADRKPPYIGDEARASLSVLLDLVGPRMRESDKSALRFLNRNATWEKNGFADVIGELDGLDSYIDEMDEEADGEREESIVTHLRRHAEIVRNAVNTAHESYIDSLMSDVDWHSERMYGDAYPAINVKVYNTPKLNAALDKIGKALEALGYGEDNRYTYDPRRMTETGKITTRIAETAWEAVQEEWWDEAREIADSYGFSIGAAGRSGGWLIVGYKVEAARMSWPRRPLLTRDADHVDVDEEDIKQFLEFQQKIREHLANADGMMAEVANDLFEDQHLPTPQGDAGGLDIFEIDWKGAA